MEEMIKTLKILQDEVAELKRGKSSGKKTTNAENAQEEYLGVDEDALSLFADGSADKDMEEDEEETDDVLKDMLGEFNKRPEGPPVMEGLAKVIATRFGSELPAEAMKEKADKLMQPSNCPELFVPKTNPKVWGGLSKITKLKDIKVANIQRDVIASACALTEAANSALLLKKKQLVPAAITKIATGMMDAVSLLGKVSRDLSHTRRDTLRHAISSEYAEICAPSAPMSSEFLFGEDLGNARRRWQLPRASQK